MTELIYKEECFAIVGAAMDVHKALGSGFLEPVYQEALEIELAERGIPFKPQAELHIRYKDHLLNKTYTADFICYDQIIVEIKALPALADREEAQVINYLNASDFQLGILINFGSESLVWKRLVLTPKHTRQFAAKNP